VPIIRSPRGNAAEMLAEKLDKKLRENLRDARNSIFTDAVQAGQLRSGLSDVYDMYYVSQL
jgi:hypothetical protein